MAHRVTVQLVGSGTHDVPYGALLPTYDVVSVDVDRRSILVEVPDVDLPSDPVHRAALTAHSWERAALPAQLHADALAAWHAHLDERYQEHRGCFRPTVA